MQVNLFSWISVSMFWVIDIFCFLQNLIWRSRILISIWNMSRTQVLILIALNWKALVVINYFLRLRLMVKLLSLKQIKAICDRFLSRAYQRIFVMALILSINSHLIWFHNDLIFYVVIYFGDVVWILALRHEIHRLYLLFQYWRLNLG